MSANRQQRRSKIRDVNRNLNLGKLFTKIKLENWNHPDWMTRAYTNNRYLVMIDDNAKTTKGTAIRAMIQRHDEMPIQNHWAELQNIKNSIFGLEAVAVEYFPRQTDLVDMHNIYWMYIFPEDVLPIPVNN